MKRGVLVAGKGDDETNVLYDKNVDAPEHLARARLAAQAPAMARLLLSMLEGRNWDAGGEIPKVLIAAGVLAEHCRGMRCFLASGSACQCSCDRCAED